MFHQAPTLPQHLPVQFRIATARDLVAVLPGTGCQGVLLLFRIRLGAFSCRFLFTTIAQMAGLCHADASSRRSRPRFD